MSDSLLRNTPKVPQKRGSKAQTIGSNRREIEVLGEKPVVRLGFHQRRLSEHDSSYGITYDYASAVPQDMDEIIPAVDQAYADALKKLGASFMLSGAVEQRAQDSTMEILLTDEPVITA